MAAKKKAKKAQKAKKASSTKASVSKGPIMPLGDRVLLRPLTQEEMNTKTSFGIIIPDTVSKEKPEQGTVIAVGLGRLTEDGKLIPMSVQVGDRVMFSKYAFDEVKIDGETYLIGSEGSIHGIVTK